MVGAGDIVVIAGCEVAVWYAPAGDVAGDAGVPVVWVTADVTVAAGV
jgi:hypothetical protein